MNNEPVLTTQNSDESVIWEGSESQIMNFGHFAATIIMMVLIIILSVVLPVSIRRFALFLLIIPVFYGVWKYLIIKFNHYKITTQRILYTRGVFSKNTETMELYRIRDLEIFQPFIHRLFGKGTVKVISADTTTPDFFIKAIPKPKELFDKLRTAVEARRDLKRVRGIEFEQ